MTHPRHRFKQRSTNAIVRRRKLHKPKEVVDDKIRKFWDKDATLKQNYARLGLATSLNSAPKMAREIAAVTPISFFSVLDKTTGKLEPVPLKLADVMDDADLAGGEEHAQEEPIHNIEEILGFGPGDADKFKSEPRKPSNNQIDNMRQLVNKYGKDFKSMARDIKLNRYQHTAKQLERIYDKCAKDL